MAANVCSTPKMYCLGLPARSHINARDPDKGEVWCDQCRWFIQCQDASKNPPRILTLNLKEQYFFDIDQEKKTEEYREAKPYWRKRLEGKTFDVIEICRRYPEKGDTDNRLWFRSAGIKLVLMKWDNAGVSVSGPTFVIKLGDRLDYPYQAMEVPAHV